MEPEERFSDLQHAIQTMIERNLDQVWTMMPAYVVSVGTNGQEVQLALGVKGQQTVYNASGKASSVPVAVPPLPNVPVHFPGGGGFTITHPINAGDEGMVHFSARCLDFWYQAGGSQPRGSARRHSLSDAIFVPGVKSKPNQLASVNQQGPAILANDGSVSISFATGGRINITAPGGLFINGAQVTAAGEVVDALGKVLGTHEHTGVQAGASLTGPPA